jgi:UDP-glucose 4-epimerase
MTVLVTGGAGYIGSHTVHRLLELGYRVVVLDNLSTGNRWAVPPGVEFVLGCVEDSTLVRETLKAFAIESVIHFAGSTDVEESVRLPKKYYENNTYATMSLVEDCIASGIENFIFSSTAAVYGFPQGLPVNESSPTAPVSPYGKSKLFAENMIADMASGEGGSNFRYVILRYFNAAGAKLDGSLGQSCRRATHLIKIACEAVQGLRESVSIYGSDYDTPDGTGVRDYIHVEDLADAHVRSLEYLSRGGKAVTLNCGYGRGFSVKQVLKVLQELTGIYITTRSEPRRKGDIPSLYADPSRIKQLLGWSPKCDDLRVICETSLNWERTMGMRNFSALGDLMDASRDERVNSQ